MTMVVICITVPGSVIGWEVTRTLPGIPRVGDHLRVMVGAQLSSGQTVESVYGLVEGVTWYEDHVWIGLEVIDADLVADGEALDERTPIELNALVGAA